MECVGRVQREESLIPLVYQGKVTASQSCYSLNGEPDCVFVTLTGLLVESRERKVIRTRQTGLNGCVTEVHLVTSRTARGFYFLLTAQSEGIAYQGWDLKKGEEQFSGVASVQVFDFWNVGSEQIKLSFSPGKPDLVTDFEPKFNEEEQSVAQCVDDALLHQLQLSRKTLATALTRSRKLDELLDVFFDENTGEKGNEAKINAFLSASIGEEKIQADNRKDEMLMIDFVEKNQPRLWNDQLIFSLSVKSLQAVHGLKVVPLLDCNSGFVCVLEEESSNELVASVQMSLEPILQSAPCLKLLFSFKAENTDMKQQIFTMTLSRDILMKKKEENFFTERILSCSLHPSKSIRLSSTTSVSAKELLVEKCGCVARDEKWFSDHEGNVFVSVQNGKIITFFGPEVKIKLLLLRMRGVLPEDVDIVPVDDDTLPGQLMEPLSNEVAAVASFARGVQRDVIKKKQQEVNVSKEKFVQFKKQLIELEEETNKMALQK